MEEKERDDIISIFAKAQEVVEEAIGTAGSSLVREQLTIHLDSNLLGRYWHEKYKPPSQPSPKSPQADFMSQMMKEIPKPDRDHDKAIDLLIEARRRVASNEADSLEWIWNAYQYFLKQLREAKSKKT